MVNARSHGDRYTRLYAIWCGMKSRCYNPNRKHYKNYGGRGIRVCADWKDDYLCFKDWAIASGYKDGLSIERIDNDGDYTPENCCWVTMKEQAKNKQSSLRFDINGRTKTLSEWCEEYGVDRHMVWLRITRYNWDVKRALETPSRIHTQRGEGI